MRRRLHRHRHVVPPEQVEAVARALYSSVRPRPEWRAAVKRAMLEKAVRERSDTTHAPHGSADTAVTGVHSVTITVEGVGDVLLADIERISTENALRAAKQIRQIVEAHRSAQRS